MCGIAGFLDLDRRLSHEQLVASVDRMSGTLRHRGPDDEGTWIDPRVGVAFGHRRLVVRDRTRAGHQPMLSADGRFVLNYNGELYNGASMARELDRLGHRFRGHSDTEVLVEGISRWGVRDALRRISGMFAFAVWDRRERRLSLARDRLGEKPLYYGWTGRRFLFASELSGIRAHPDVAGRLDRGALTAYARLGYVPAPLSILEGARKLEPGHLLDVSIDGQAATAAEAYWVLPEVSSSGDTPASDAAAVEGLRERLRTSVRRQLTADVPVGAFLSGGIDSSLIVALMQEECGQQVRTFTIGFEEGGFDESPHARAVAQHLGTHHTDHIITADEALAVVPDLPRIYDEPFADSSQIPTYLLARLAREQVTVALTGDGGDELMSGYDRHGLRDTVWPWTRRVPAPFRVGLADQLERSRPGSWDRRARIADVLSNGRLSLTRPGEKLRRLGRVLRAESPEDAYVALMSVWQDPERLVLNGHEASGLLTSPDLWPAGASFGDRLAKLDLRTYLPDDLLVKVDRATMAVSLEARVPLLDHELVEWSAGLPYHFKVRDGERKWLLRRLLDDYVPRSVVARPKMGFGVPIGTWLAGPLRPWAEELISPARLRREGIFDSDMVRAAWDGHLSGRSDRRHELWVVLMFQAWFEGFVGESSTS